MSRLSAMKANLVTEFEVISTANDYNTDPVQVIQAIRSPEKIADLDAGPEIGIECGVERVRATDEALSVFESYVPVMVVAAVKCDTDTGDETTNLEAAAEAVRQDMKRVIGTIMVKYGWEAGNEWNISPQTGPIELGAVVGQGLKRNLAVVGCTFDVNIKNQDGDF